MIEKTLSISGREIKLSPTHKAIFAIEEETGLAVYDLIVNHSLKIKEACSILYNCARAAGEKISKDEMAELVVGSYTSKTQLLCIELLNTVFGKEKEEDKKKETAETVPS